MSAPTPGEVLRNLGMKGILTQPPEKGGIDYLFCDMGVCYCPRGRGYFEPISRDLEGRLTYWMPTEEHWPRSQADGGRRTKGNVWLAHRRCNELVVGTGTGHKKRREKEMARKLDWADSNPAEYVYHFGNREAAEACWREHSSRRTAHPSDPNPLGDPEKVG